MEKSKLLLVLSRMNRLEINRLEDYIDSPFFNKHVHIQRLAKYLLPHAPKFEQKKRFEKERVFSKIYPKKTYNDNLWHSLVAKTLKLVCDFLAYLEQEKEERRQQIYLISALRQRNLEKQLNAAVRRYHKLGTEAGTEQQYLENYHFYEELDLNFIQQSGRAFDPNLQLRNDYLDLFFLTQKLKIACDMANRNLFIQADYKTTMLDDLLQYMQQRDAAYQDIPILKIYLSIWYLLTEKENEIHFKKLKELLAQHHQDFNSNELAEMYRYALNYCAKRINQGDATYYKEVFVIYKFLLERKIIFQDGFLPAPYYKNLVTIALRLKEYEWGKTFIEDYVKYLLPEIRENAYRLNLASWYYETNKYGQALQALYNVEFVDATYGLGARIIQLKSYYALEEFEAIGSAVEAFKLYVKRNKELSAYRQQATLNFLKLFAKLSKLKEGQDWMRAADYQKKYKAAQTLMQKTSPMANKDWIVEALDILKMN